MITFTQSESKILFDIGFREFVSRKLDPVEMIILQLLISDYTVVDIAKMNNCSRRTIYNVINGLKNKFSDFFDSHIP